MTSLALEVEVDTLWFTLFFRQHWVPELEIVTASPRVCLVLLLDLVVFLMLVEYLQELLVVVVHPERQQVHWAHAIL